MQECEGCKYLVMSMQSHVDAVNTVLMQHRELIRDIREASEAWRRMFEKRLSEVEKA